MSIPSPSSITREQIQSCLSVYSDVVKAHYQKKTKGLERASEAIERDYWRYEELPGAIQKAPFQLWQLEKLVQWKITHGRSRPFLPAMVRKNLPELVKAQTSSTAKIVNLLRSCDDKADSLKHTLDAMTDLGVLKGVGPATSSLLASVYSPNDVPFFEDELFTWLCVDEGATDGQLKLKYDKKEYAQLFNAVWELRTRLGKDETRCVDIEKAAFVLMHIDLLGQGKEEFKDIVESVESESKADDENQIGVKPTRRNAAKSKTNQEPVKKSSKRNLKAESGTEGAAEMAQTQKRPKRLKK